MKRFYLLFTLTGLCLLISGVAQAQSGAFQSITKDWAGTATLGGSWSSGNTSSSSVSGDIRIGKNSGLWEHLVFGSVFKGNSALIVEERDPETGALVLDDSGRPIRRIIKGDNSNRRALGYQPKYYWRPKTFVFGILDWESDKPANIDSAIRQIAGFGYKFYVIENGFLSAEIGAGNKNLKKTTGEDIDGAIGYLGINLLHKVGESIKLNADLRSDFGSDNTFIELGLGLTVAVSNRIAFKLSHFSRNNSDLEDTTNPLSSSSDSITSVNLVFNL